MVLRSRPVAFSAAEPHIFVTQIVCVLRATCIMYVYTSAKVTVTVHSQAAVFLLRISVLV